jgi:predicted ABC-type ATPase
MPQIVIRAGPNGAGKTTLAARFVPPDVPFLNADNIARTLAPLPGQNADLPVQRVAARVQSGGHDIPEPVIRRRYEAGLNNFFALYRPLANLWRIYDNTQPVEPALIAKGTLRVQQAALWEQIKKG